NGANPIGIVIPCHRVIGADRKLHDYRQHRYGRQHPGRRDWRVGFGGEAEEHDRLGQRNP
ncbi:MAG TPA: MGMT family protein, partial [Candidatus Latescibacteria bacterium]|nr:MGMT family protein [Candidatus Latescibacterota bacterium]